MTELVGMTPLHRLHIRVAGDPALIRRMAVVLWGMAYARAGVLGITGPFGAALVAGVGYDDSLSACLGAVAGYLLVQQPAQNLGFVLLSVVIAAVKLLAGRRRWESYRWAAGCTAGVCSMAVGLPILFLTGGAASDYAILAAQVVMAVSAACFTANLYVAGQPMLTHRGRITDASIVISLCILAAGLVDLQLWGVSAGKIVAALLTLCTAYALGGSGGAGVGTACGLAVAFASGEFNLSVALYALGGLISGAFRPMGRMAAAIAFVLCSGFVMLGTGRQVPVASFIEVAVGSSVFFALPENFFSRLSRAFAPESFGDNASRKMVMRRLRQCSEALQQICVTTRRVAQRLEERAGIKEEELADVLSGAVCRRCPKNALCWSDNYGDTVGVLNALLERLRRNETATAEEFPAWFRQRCLRPDHLMKTGQQLCQEYAAAEQMRRKASRARALVVDQFEGMAMFLGGIEQEIRGSCSASPIVAARMREAFSRWGAEPLSLNCLMVGDRMMIEAVLGATRQDRVDWKALSRLAGEACGRSFALAETQPENNRLTVVLRERPKFRVKIGAAQASQQEGKICGDSWYSFVTPDQKQHILLSDGMGCGGRAALDSGMAVSLMTRLIEAGADHNSALRMANSSLLVKSGEESLATMDALSIDLYSGRVGLFKAGAAPTVLRQGKKAGSIESVSAPVGIVNGACFEQSRFLLKENDWIVMLSDGATAAGVDWIAEELECCREEEPQELAQKLCRAAGLRRSDGRSDDITVICALLESESL